MQSSISSPESLPGLYMAGFSIEGCLKRGTVCVIPWVLNRVHPGRADLKATCQQNEISSCPLGSEGSNTHRNQRRIHTVEADGVPLMFLLYRLGETEAMAKPPSLWDPETTGLWRMRTCKFPCSQRAAHTAEGGQGQREASYWDKGTLHSVSWGPRRTKL